MSKSEVAVLFLLSQAITAVLFYYMYFRDPSNRMSSFELWTMRAATWSSVVFNIWVLYRIASWLLSANP